jgi:hypothetical protein
MLEQEENLKKVITESLLTIIPEEATNIIINFLIGDDSWRITTLLTKKNGEIFGINYDEYQKNKEKIKKVNRFIEKKFFEIRKLNNDEWVSCLFWTNRDGKNGMILYY